MDERPDRWYWFRAWLRESTLFFPPGLDIPAGATLVRERDGCSVDPASGTVADTGLDGLYSRLDAAGHGLTRFEESVSSRMPTPGERSSLGLADGVPVVLVARLAFAGDRPVELNETVLAADRYVLGRRVPAD